MTGASFSLKEEVDFIIVGAGAAGGVVARELSRGGMSVVVLEQGPYLRIPDFHHDELATSELSSLTNDFRKSPNSFRESADKAAVERPSVKYGRMVGGGSAHFTGNYWRFHEVDFIENSRKGPVPGADRDDWPITYADLEPYYTKVEWEIGVSGLAGVNPFDPPRSKPYPLPPLPIKPTGVLLERGAQKLGLHAAPAPMAILSKPYRGRSGCVHCGMCEGFGCEVGAKSSTLATMIPEAERTGKCEVRAESYVTRVETNDRGRVTGVTYIDAKGRTQHQRAKAVVLSANGAETPRLLFLSESSRFPHGLANSSGVVGTHLMFNGGVFTGALFEHEINGYRGVVDSRIVHDFYELPASANADGGGGIDFRFDLNQIGFALFGLGVEAPTWGAKYKQMLRERYTRTLYALGHTTQLPVATNTISLDDKLKDAWGSPALRVTFSEHPNDMEVYKFFAKRSEELLDAAGAVERWSYPLTIPMPQVHLLGTCRMGNDPQRSVVDKWHRAHDVPNLFIVDGSSFVTSGRGQPTMTIQALAFRAAEGMVRSAKRGEI